MNERPPPTPPPRYRYSLPGYRLRPLPTAFPPPALPHLPSCRPVVPQFPPPQFPWFPGVSVPLVASPRCLPCSVGAFGASSVRGAGQCEQREDVKNSKSTALSQLPNGDWYFVRRDASASRKGYGWKTGMGASPRDARNRALGRETREDAPPVRPNTPEFRRRVDGTYPAV